MMSSVLVVGAGKIGRQLATLLADGGHGVTVVERDLKRASEMADLLGEAAVVTGSGTEAAILERAGIRRCDVVAAVTGADETNLVVASLARFEFEVRRVIARIVDPRNSWMFREDMGVDVALNQADILAHLVAEELSLGEMTILLRLRRGQYALVEEAVAPGSAVIGQRIEQISWPARCQLVGVIRGGDMLTPEADLGLREGDEVLAVAHSEVAPVLAALLSPPDQA